MLRLFVLALVAWLLFVSSCSPMSISKRGQVQICGKVLAETLNMLCQGQYYDPKEKEENDIRRSIWPQNAAGFDREWYLGFPFRRTHDMGNRHPMQPNERQQRGVVDECCRQSCSPSVLLSYCRPHK